MSYFRGTSSGVAVAFDYNLMQFLFQYSFCNSSSYLYLFYWYHCFKYPLSSYLYLFYWSHCFKYPLSRIKWSSNSTCGIENIIKSLKTEIPMDKMQSMLKFKIECTLYYVSLTYVCNKSLSSRVFCNILKLSILSIFPVLWQLSPSSGTQTPFLSFFFLMFVLCISNIKIPLLKSN